MRKQLQKQLKRLLQGMFTIPLVLMLTACCSLTQQSKGIQLPPSLTQPCQALETLEGTTGADVIKNITNNAAIYYECSDSKNALIKAIQENNK